MILSTISLTMPLSREQFIETAKSDAVKAGQALDGELSKFNAYLRAQGFGELVKHERDILREYLAFKLLAGTGKP